MRHGIQVNNFSYSKVIELTVNTIGIPVVRICIIEDFKSGVLPAKIVEKEQKILQKLIY